MNRSLHKLPEYFVNRRGDPSTLSFANNGAIDSVAFGRRAP
jgi:hypothetical protein